MNFAELVKMAEREARNAEVKIAFRDAVRELHSLSEVELASKRHIIELEQTIDALTVQVGEMLAAAQKDAAAILQTAHDDATTIRADVTQECLHLEDRMKSLTDESACLTNHIVHLRDECEHLEIACAAATEELHSLESQREEVMTYLRRLATKVDGYGKN